MAASRLEKEDYQLAGILMQMRDLLGHVGSSNQNGRDRDETVLEMSRLVKLALSIVYNEKVELEKQRKLLAISAKMARELEESIRSAETA